MIRRTVCLNVPFTNQKPGTSGLRKSNEEFAQPHYLESFIEGVLRTLPAVQGGTLILGGDGRYGNRHAIDVILRMAAAHGVRRVITATDGILSTPAASHLIRKHQAIGGIILSASHNPGGPGGDFGVKINGPNGGPVPDLFADAVFACTQDLKHYSIFDSAVIPLHKPSQQAIGKMQVEVIDGVNDFVTLMQQIFDFERIKDLIDNDFPLVFDALHAVTGPYARRLFEDLLGAPAGSVRNSKPLEDFNGGHPDPNLTYAHELADLLLKGKAYCFGAACDGDGDRNMIMGTGCFVNPSDSLAILTANAYMIPAYASGLTGVARSMPTSSAVDLVARKLGIDCYETPTGWKFFGNLLDAGRITLCGEESFGTGSNHIREKDGLWAVLFWLQILAERRCSVAEIMNSHWRQFGRHYYSRHDYEAVPSMLAHRLYNRLEDTLVLLEGQSFAGRNIITADNFSYTDPVDGSLTKRQGLRILLEGGSRVIIRLSGTGTKGTTIRVYLESYVTSDSNINQNPQVVLADMIDDINALAEIKDYTNMVRPTVIT